eukprot:TRINITY_DN3729_c0_g1_i10.p1 TRINITY_DN3729_c0_g1~~TRINITY_DN3729_c0_g1_i10.p1  ORF type:complete len:226 (+),score=68.19 TRINITY_DN3729_c0_g1_i10:65-742(+)
MCIRDSITTEGKTFTVSAEYLKFEEKEVNVMEEKYCPNVIEPSFGVGRIIYSIFEHRFRMRDERRTYIDFPPKIAPIKCSLLPVVSNEEYDRIIAELKKSLKRAGLSSKIDDSGQSIGKRYARTDEVGIPFGITVDNDTLKDQTVTLREINTMKQVRIPIKEVVQVLSDIVEGHLQWTAVLQKYPLFEAKEADDAQIEQIQLTFICVISKFAVIFLLHIRMNLRD